MRVGITMCIPTIAELDALRKYANDSAIKDFTKNHCPECGKVLQLITEPNQVLDSLIVKCTSCEFTDDITDDDAA